MDPITAIAIAQLALQLIAAQSASGPDISDLLAIQAATLKKISQEIGKVQSGITLIFNSLEQIKELISALPSDVVIELYRAQITGLITRYLEVTDAYVSERDLTGIESANRSSHAEFNELIDQVRNARGVLMGYRHEMTIPIIALALQTEVHCMILGGENDSRMKPAISTYSDWLARWLDDTDPASLSSLIVTATKSALSLRDARTNGRYNTDGLATYNMTARSVGGRVLLSGTRRYLTYADEDAVNYERVTAAGRDLNVDRSILPDIFFEMKAKVADVVEETLQTPPDGNDRARFEEIEARSEFFKKHIEGYGDYGHPEALERELAFAKLGERELTVARLRLLALGGFYCSVRTSFAFCEKLLGDLNKRQMTTH